MLAPSILACGRGDPTTPHLADFGLTARPGIPTLVPGTGESTLGLGNGRDGILYVPASYVPATPAPLFVALHGAGGWGRDWRGFFSAAENRGVVLLAPDSRGSTWDLMLGSVGPDVTFLDRALLHTFERCRVDAARIALAGFSDGASYALSAGIPNGELFSHIVAFSPGFLSPGVASSKKPGIFVSHGAADPVLSFVRTRDQIVPALRDSGYEVTFREFDGGHGVPAEVGTAALDWFLAQPSSPSE